MSEHTVRSVPGATLAPAAARALRLSVGASRHESTPARTTSTWPDLVSRLSRPQHGAETVAQYLALDPAAQTEAKDVGTWVPGHFIDSTRRAASLRERDALTLDLDHCPAGLDIRAALDGSPLHGVAWALHSTRKHRPESPRYRLVVPLARGCTHDEHEPLARAVGASIAPPAGSLDWLDAASFRWAQVAFWPSVCRDSEFVFATNDAPMLDPGAWLADYYLGDAWEDSRIWPRLASEREAPHVACKRVGDPRTKPGIVGAFCRAYGVLDALDKFVPDAYAPGSKSGRLTFTRGTGADGAVIYENGLGFYPISTDG